MRASDKLFIQDILMSHIEQMSKDIDGIANGTVPFTPCFIDAKKLIMLSETVSILLAREPTVLELTPPIIVVGDIHGHILDLYRILVRFDLPPSTKYLFLGDLVDRGPFSVEAVTLILTLKVLYPNHIYIIRGNHEFRHPVERSTFRKDIETMYPNTTLFDNINTAFDYLPIAAKIGKILCVHAGISPNLKNIDQIYKIRKPLQSYTEQILEGILWSDPSEDVETFKDSPRGIGNLFGKAPFLEFMKNSQIKLLIRGHECVDGTKIMFDGKLLNVFSASNYTGNTINKAGVVSISEDERACPVEFPPLTFLTRADSSITRPRSRSLNRNIEMKPIPGSLSNNRIPKILSDKSFCLRPRMRTCTSNSFYVIGSS